MCIGLIFYSFIDIIIIIYFLRPLISITYKMEFKILIFPLILSLSMYTIVTTIIQFIEYNTLKLVVGLFIGISSYLFLSYITKSEELAYLLKKIHYEK